MSDIKFALTWDGTNGSLITLPAPFVNSHGFALNSSGACVGSMWQSNLNPGPTQAFLAENGKASLLPTLVDDIGAIATSINDLGVVVGCSDKNGETAVRWINMVPEALAVPIGPNSVALDVNAKGQICGWMGSSPTHLGAGSHAYLWTDGTCIDLGSFEDGAVARSLNDFGDVAGYGFLHTQDPLVPLVRGLVWSNGRMIVIEPSSGYVSTQAVDINGERRVIGRLLDADLNEVPFTWKDGELRVLPTLIEPSRTIDLWFVSGINDAGEIAGTGLDESGNAVAMLLTPIPPIVGDLTCDWIVDGEDLGLLLSAWGKCAVAPQQDRGGRDGRSTDGDRPTEPPPCPADLNGDTTVDGADLGLLLSNWTS